MTQVAFIPPVSLLDYTFMTSYQLVLPHMLDNAEYRAHYTRLAESTEHFMILDNGEAEGENNYEARYLFELASTTGYDEVVAHDVMGDMLATMDKTADFLDAIQNMQGEGSPQVGIVAQGRSVAEVSSFVEYFVNSDYQNSFHTIYLPRLLIGQLGSITARTDLAVLLDKKFNLRHRYAVHFLGAHHDAPVEVQRIGQTAPWVRGIDTSMPFNYAYYGALLGNGHYQRPDGYFDLNEADFQEPIYIRKNADQILKWAKAPSLIRTVGASEV
jgi:hypothetical protein